MARTGRRSQPSDLSIFQHCYPATEISWGDEKPNLRRELRAIASAFARVAEARGLVTWTRDSKGRITFGELVQVSVTDDIRPIIKP